jgi:hypothetical protein
MRRFPSAAVAIVLLLAALLAAGPARADELAFDSFSRPDADVLGVADSGQRWTPMSLSGTQAWGIRSGEAAFIPDGDDFIRYARLDTHSTSPSTMTISGDLTFSRVSANIGLAVNLGARDRVFCKVERTPNPHQPYGFMAIGGRFDGNAEVSVLGTARSSFSREEQLTLGTTYHVVLSRSASRVTCSISGTNANGAPVDETVHYALASNQANGLVSPYAGLRFRYVVGEGSSNEDDGGSRWDNIVVSDAT